MAAADAHPHEAQHVPPRTPCDHHEAAPPREHGGCAWSEGASASRHERAWRGRRSVHIGCGLERGRDCLELRKRGGEVLNDLPRDHLGRWEVVEVLEAVVLEPD